jgi:hypothetical protein
MSKKMKRPKLCKREEDKGKRRRIRKINNDKMIINKIPE